MSFLIFVDESYSNKISTSNNTQSSSMNKGKIPRPKNAFMLYRQEKQKILPLSKKRVLSKDFSKTVGEMWRNEKDDIRKYFHLLADREKIEHTKKYPEYKYNPRQKKKTSYAKNKEYKEQPSMVSIDKEAENLSVYENTIKIVDSVFHNAPPSSVVQDLQLFPEGSNLDFLSYDEYELHTQLSAIFHY
uniref:SexM n=1 Tax=Syzygites megalocarpus TaxID=101119 RepID=G8G8T0_9FUNG|nr:SexM [Syzygites megalocarpus]